MLETCRVSAAESSDLGGVFIHSTIHQTHNQQDIYNRSQKVAQSGFAALFTYPLRSGVELFLHKQLLPQKQTPPRATFAKAFHKAFSVCRNIYKYVAILIVSSYG